MVLVFAVIFLKRTVLHEVVVDISWSLCEVFVESIIKSSVKYKQSSSGFPLNVVKVMKSHAKI